MLSFIEKSQFVDWFLISIWGFPVFIALHSVGMAMVAGLSVVIALRCFGLGRDIERDVLTKLFRVAWIGFTLNVLTGLGLLASRIREYIVDPTFLVKMLFVFVAIVALAFIQRRSGFTVSTRLGDRFLSLLAIFAWMVAITAGRWIAYLSELYT